MQKNSLESLSKSVPMILVFVGIFFIHWQTAMIVVGLLLMITEIDFTPSLDEAIEEKVHQEMQLFMTAILAEQNSDDFDEFFGDDEFGDHADYNPNFFPPWTDDETPPFSDN